MPFPTIAAAIVNLVIAQLLPLFLPAAGDDLTVARDFAVAMLAVHKPETEDEVHLAAEIAALRVHFLSALAEAAAADVPLRDRIRLRSGAVSLSREVQRLRRSLDVMQTERRSRTESALDAAPGTQHKVTQSPVTEHPVTPEDAARVVDMTRKAIANAGPPPGKMTWTQTYQQRQRDKRLAQHAMKNLPPADTERLSAPG